MEGTRKRRRIVADEFAEVKDALDAHAPLPVPQHRFAIERRAIQYGSEDRVRRKKCLPCGGSGVRNGTIKERICGGCFGRGFTEIGPAARKWSWFE